MSIRQLLTAISLFAVSIGSASAATYQYEINNGSFGGGAGGSFEQLKSTYDSDTEQLTWTLKNGQINGAGAVDGFWLVLNDGPNPKQSNVNELAILYADFTNNKLLAYAYNGQNNANSINSPGILIGDYSSSIIETSDTIGFSFDASAINAFTHPSIVPTDWKGIQYDENIGVWFHVSYGTTITGNAQSGFDFSYQTQRWYDTANQQTTVVPIPAAAFLLAPVLAGFMATRRKLTNK